MDIIRIIAWTRWVERTDYYSVAQPLLHEVELDHKHQTQQTQNKTNLTQRHSAKTRSLSLRRLYSLHTTFLFEST